MIIPTAEPFFFPGSQTGCLLVHGFTGTPKEMRWMGEYLAAQGWTALGTRLPGHATRPEDMLRLKWTDWLAAVEDGWHLLSGACDQIFLAGLSLGGVLALLFAGGETALRCPAAGVIAMSTPYALPADPRLKFIRALRYIQPTVPKGPSDWHDQAAARDHIDYPYYPTLAIAQLRDVIDEMHAALPNVKVPVLLVHSRLDTRGDWFVPDSMQQIYDHLGTSDKQMLWVEDCGHVIVREPVREQVFQAAADFIRQHSTAER